MSHRKDVRGIEVQLLVGLQLQLEAQVGTHLRTFALQELQSLQKSHPLELDEVGNDQGGRLPSNMHTLETPAPQCTRTPPFLRPA